MAQYDTSDHSLGDAGALLHSVSQLTGWIAHEVNNSLGGIHTSFALLQRLIPTDHPHYRYVDALQREIARASGLTQRLQQGYDFNEAGASRLPVCKAIDSACRLLAPLSMARGVTVLAGDATPAEPNPEVSALGQAAIRHLLQHVIESCGPTDEVRVEGRQDAGMTLVSVSWSVSGTREEKLPRSGPPGFALMMSQQLARALAGEITLVSQDGSTPSIRLRLPTLAPTE